jgi:hypothetical protein
MGIDVSLYATVTSRVADTAVVNGLYGFIHIGPVPAAFSEANRVQRPGTHLTRTGQIIAFGNRIVEARSYPQPVV